MGTSNVMLNRHSGHSITITVTTLHGILVGVNSSPFSQQNEAKSFFLSLTSPWINGGFCMGKISSTAVTKQVLRPVLLVNTPGRIEGAA
jgi:hypothetical protein